MCLECGPWWVIHEQELLKLLRRVANGEDPDLVYVEAFVNVAPERQE